MKLFSSKSPWEISERKIKLALIGLGRVAQTHLNAIEQFPNDLELVDVCDKSI